jgi:hypothetical protein
LEKLDKLSLEKRLEVERFVEAILREQKPKTKGKLRQDWAGALKDLRGKYTSVELQHKISEWRIGEK